MAERESFYILLDLQFDPPVNDPKQIETAINNKQQEWSALQNHPIKRNTALEHLGMLDEIKRTMADPSLRKLEADKALKKKSAVKEEIKNKLDQVGRGKKYVKPKEIENLVNKYKEYGISVGDIEKICPYPISETPPIDPDEGKKIEITDEIITNSIKKNLNQLQLSNYDLYKFLGQPNNAPLDKLVTAAEIKRKNANANANKTGALNAELELTGICFKVFKNEVSQKKYDNYLKISKYEAVNEAIAETAKMNGKKIERAEYESIINLAIKKYGIDVSEAISYIRNHCAVYDITVDDGSKVVCASCSTENPANATTCIKCKRAMKIECPSCGFKNENNAPKCSKCRFDLSQMEKAVELIKKANEALGEHKIESAQKLIEQAKIYWPNHHDIAELDSRISTLRKQFDESIASIMEDVNHKRFYSALTKINQAKNKGFEVDPMVENRVKTAVSNVEGYIAKAKTGSSDEAFFQLTKANEEIADSKEIKELLQKYPPEAPDTIECQVNMRSINISWPRSSSKGSVSYRLVRKKNSQPNNQSDGDVVFEGAALSYSDDQVEVSQEYYYAVFSVREGIVSSTPAVSQPVVVIVNVSNIKSAPGDGSISLTWDTNSTVKEIKVWRSVSDSPPRSVDECTPVFCSRLDGLNDTALENGKKCWYIIRAIHFINGKLYESNDELVNALPQKPAKPVVGFKIVNNDDTFTAFWDKCEWDVVLLYSDKTPDYKIGQLYEMTELLKSYKRIELLSQGRDTAEFRLNFTGGIHVIPAVVNSSFAILGNSFYLTNVPPVKSISYDTSGNELYVNFDWPKSIKKVLMVYRFDDYPEAPDDPLANLLTCTKQQYDNDAAILIKNPEFKSYYTKLYSVYEAEKRVVYSEGVPFTFNNEPQREVYYSLKYSKSLLGGKHKLAVSIKSNGQFTLPRVIFVKKNSSVPLGKGDGEIICSSQEEKEIRGSETYKFEITALPKDCFVKMFIIDERLYKRFKFLVEGSNKVS